MTGRTEELRDAYREWFESIDRHDGNFVDRYMTSDFTYVDLEGEERGRDEYKKMYDTIAPGYVGVHEIRDFTVRELAASGALVQGTYDAEMKFADGREIAGCVRFSSVWIAEESQWKCVLHHTSRTTSKGGDQS